MPVKVFIFIYFLTNLITFILYGVDKYKSSHGKWRIKERTLLLWGLIAGALGQMAGMHIFHHKTRKWYFVLISYISIVVQIFLIYRAVIYGFIQ